MGAKKIVFGLLITLMTISVITNSVIASTIIKPVLTPSAMDTGNDGILELAYDYTEVSNGIPAYHWYVGSIEYIYNKVGHTTLTIIYSSPRYTGQYEVYAIFPDGEKVRIYPSYSEIEGRTIGKYQIYGFDSTGFCIKVIDKVLATDGLPPVPVPPPTSLNVNLKFNYTFSTSLKGK